ncbi:unnamed protein product [Camellia sinensis]
MGCRKILLAVLDAMLIVMLLLPFHQVASRELAGTSHFLVADMTVMNTNMNMKTKLKEADMKNADPEDGNYEEPAGGP